MNRNALRIVSLASLIVATSWAAPGLDADDEGTKPAPSAAVSRPIPDEVIRQAGDVVEAVLRHHFDPPTRQEMMLSAIKTLRRSSGAPIPPGLARRVSDATDFDQLAELLDASWPRGKSVEVLKAVFYKGLLEPVAGDSRFMTDKEYKVEQQIAGNRYEGVHISLGSEGEGEDARPTISGVIANGPADRAGAKVKDLIEAIDGVDTRGMDIRKVVDRIRGPLGSAVEFRVRQPDSQEARTLKMTRERLFMPTIVGLSKKPSGEWNHRIDGPESIAYLRIGQINASTPHELRQIAEQLDDDPPRGVILDLRALQQCDFHSTVVLADSLLASGAIGRLHTGGRTTTFQADPDELFRGRPIAVLIDEATSGVSEWLTAALQDNGRAVVVGSPRAYWNPPVPAGAMILVAEAPIDARKFVYETVPVGDGGGWLSLVVGCLERAGRPGHPAPDPPATDHGRGPRTRPLLADAGPLAIKPDRRVVLPGTRDRDGWRRGLFSMMGDSGAHVDPVKDPYVAAAVQDLRDKLKKPDSHDRPRGSK